MPGIMTVNFCCRSFLFSTRLILEHQRHDRFDTPIASGTIDRPSCQFISVVVERDDMVYETYVNDECVPDILRIF